MSSSRFEDLLESELDRTIGEQQSAVASARSTDYSAHFRRVFAAQRRSRLFAASPRRRGRSSASSSASSSAAADASAPANAQSLEQEAAEAEAEALRSELLSVEDRLSSAFLALPEELHAYIATFCGVRGISSLAQVNRYFGRLLAPDSFVWQHVPELIFPGNGIMDFRSIKAMVARCECLRGLSLRGCARELGEGGAELNDEGDSDGAASYYGAGSNAGSRRGLPTPATLGFLPPGRAFPGGAADFESDEEEELDGDGDSDMGDVSSDDEMRRGPRMRRRKMPPTPIVQLLSLSPHLVHLDVSYTNLDVSAIPLPALCPELRVFKAAGCYTTSDGQAFVIKMLTSFDIEYLDLTACKGIYLSAGLPPGTTGDRLHTLLVGHTRVFDSFWTTAACAFELCFPSLRVLSLAATGVSSDIVNNELVKLMNLQELDISKCTMLSAIHFQHASIRSLLAKNCSQLQTLGLDTSMLEMLDIRSCSALSRLAIRTDIMEAMDFSDLASLEQITLACAKLGALELVRCASLAAGGLSVTECPVFETLSCRQMDSWDDRSLGEICAIPQLKHVLLEGCARVRGILLPAHCQLQSLSVVGCNLADPDSSLVSSDPAAPLPLRALCMSSMPSLTNHVVEKVLGLPSTAPGSRTTAARIDMSPDARIAPLRSSAALLLSDFSRMADSRQNASVAMHLRELDLSFCPRITESLVQAALTACVNLDTLRLRQCNWVYSLRLSSGHSTAKSQPDASETQLVSNTAALRVLDLESCQNLESVIVDPVLSPSTSLPPRLESLNLAWCTKLAALQVASDELRSLSLRGCTGLNRVELSSAVLPTIDISHALKLTHLNLHLPLLTELRLSKISSLTDTMLQDGILAHTPVLTLMVLMGCRRVECLDLTRLPHIRNVSLQEMRALARILLPSSNCRLTSLEIAMCAKLSQPMLEHIVSEAAPMLRHLSIRLMPGLTAPHLRSGSLDSIQFLQCQRLEALQLECPRLFRVGLRGVPLLAEVSMLCRFLKVIEVDQAVLTRAKRGILAVLRLTDLPRFNRSVAIRLATVAPALRRLELIKCGEVQEAAIAVLQQLFPGLRVRREDSHNKVVLHLE